MNNIDDINKIKNELDNVLSKVDVENINLDTVTLRIGSTVVRLQKIDDNPIDMIDEIKGEFKQKLTEKLSVIANIVNEKLSSAIHMIDSIKYDYERKEKIIKEKLAMASPMPNVNYGHAIKGLSVVKGRSAGELIWLVRSVYKPKFLDRKPISSRAAKRMIRPIIICISTTDNKVTCVSTRKVLNLDYFNHYHQSKPDCWGDWKYSRNWKIPEDIIDIANQAESVLENINSLSLAERNPRGLPRMSTVTKNIEQINPEEKLIPITNEGRIYDPDANVWST